MQVQFVSCAIPSRPITHVHPKGLSTDPLTMHGVAVEWIGIADELVSNPKVSNTPKAPCVKQYCASKTQTMAAL